MSMSEVITGHHVTTHNNTIANLTRGVGERVLYTNSHLVRPIRPKEMIFENKLASYRKFIARGCGWQSPVSRQAFVGYYTGPRQAMYQRVVNGLELSPVRPRDARLKTFVKAEKINLTLKQDPVPRVIQPRNPRYNVEVGRYLRPIEKLIYKQIDELFKGPTVMSEYNAYRQAEVLNDKWNAFTTPACVGLDASRFDQHVSVDALKFEHKLYDMIYHSKELKSLLKLQLKNVGIAVASDGILKYTTHGSRMSGDMNTSLGNKILMCLMAKSYIDQLGVEVKFVNNGDDCLLFLEKRNLPHLSGLKSYFAEFGFNIVTERPVFNFEQVVFCQTQPIRVNGIWRMVRQVKTCLSKDLTNVDLGHRVDEYRGWLKDVAACGLTVAKDVPVLGAFYRMLQRFGTDSAYTSRSDDEYRWYRLASKNARCTHDSTDDEGRLSFWVATGLSPDEQVLLEDYFDTAVWGQNKRQLITTITSLFND